MFPFAQNGERSLYDPRLCENRPVEAYCRDLTKWARNPPDCNSGGFIDNWSISNCGSNLSFRQYPGPPYDADKTTRVTLTVTDSAGNIDTCTGDVTVKRAEVCRQSPPINESPVAICEDIEVTATGGDCAVDADEASIDAGSYDPDPDGYIQYRYQSPGGPYEAGTTTWVQLTVTDNMDATDSCWAKVVVKQGPYCQVVGVGQPRMYCKERFQRADWPACTKNLYINNGSTDYYGSRKGLSKKQRPQGPYSIGTTEVTLTVTDKYGNTNTCTRDVTVLPDTYGKCPLYDYDFSDGFCDGSPFTLNGSDLDFPIYLDSTEGCALRLTPDSVGIRASSAFLPLTMRNSDFSFGMEMGYRMFGTNSGSADGITFTMHQDGDGLSALGTAGGDLGVYNGIQPALVVELDSCEYNG